MIPRIRPRGPPRLTSNPLRLAAPQGRPLFRPQAPFRRLPSRPFTTHHPHRFAAPEPSLQASEPIPPPPPRRRRTGLISAALFLALGLALGTPVRLFLQPPTPPVPGSAEDTARAALLAADASALPIFQQLSTDTEWTNWTAYSAAPPAASPAPGAASRLTTGALSGTRGLAYQHIFAHAPSGRFVTVVHFGPALAGWPGVVHGGALATLLDESLGRCAIAALPGRTGVTARLELAYRAPALANRFYVLRCRALAPEELEPEERAKAGRKAWVVGTLETLDGKVCVEARGLFVAPRGLKLASLPERF